MTLLCGISWVDSQGNPTPDNHPAIALAQCFDPRTFGEKGSEKFPICREHALIKGKFWKLLPLPGQLPDHSNIANNPCDLLRSLQHPLVQANRDFKIIPDVVIASIRKSFPQDSDSILDSLRWSHVNGCFSFQRWEMYVGVEEDGFIHT